MSPSGLYQDLRCDRHFWLRVNQKLTVPSGHPSAVFGVVDRAMKKWLASEGWAHIEARTVEIKSGKIHSAPLVLPTSAGEVSMLFRGYTDIIIREPDGIHIVDLKMTPSSKTDAKLVETYSNQLAAYAFMLSTPATGSGENIKGLGILGFGPSERFGAFDDEAVLGGNVRFIPVDPYQAGVEFHQEMDRLARVAVLPAAPEPSEDCEFCAYERKVADLS